MKQFKSIALTLLLIIIGGEVLAQNGFVRGTVFEGESGWGLPGVTIAVDGQPMGTITDLDGKFNLSLPEGTYTIRISFVSYKTIVIQNVSVKPGEVTLVGELKLQTETKELEEITVTATQIRNTETAMLSMKHKAATLLDGVSADGLKRTGDSDVASSIKRVPGVSISGGKYVFVRGLGDRYTKTVLNGVDIPGLDPDRNTLQMDIFPTNIIDNLVVYKSFTADLPADFTGGVINIETKDFPDELNGSVSVSSSYNPNFHLNSDFLTYEGGKTDYLGFDDGTRAIPATGNIPLFADVVGAPDSKEGQRYRNILESFNPNLAAYKQQSFVDYSVGASFGNQIPKDKVTYGYNGAFSYKRNIEFYEDAEFGRYGLPGNPDLTEMETRELQTGDFGSESVLVTGLVGFAVKTKNSKYSINVMHLQNGVSRAGIFDYYNADQGSVFEGVQHNLEYNQRSLTNAMVSGTHRFDNSKWDVEWKFSPTYSQMEDPDIRFTRYEIRGDEFVIGTEAGFPERIWRDLEELSLAGILNFTKEFNLMAGKSKFKFGGAVTNKERDFVIRSFAMNIRNLDLTGNPNELFLPENLWPHNGGLVSGTSYEVSFIPNNPNQFNGRVNNIASYASLEFFPVEKLKTIVGIRTEYNTQYYTGQDQLGTNKLVDEEVLNDVGIFPTLNLSYALKDNQNLRFAFTKTIARPSFKELSFAEIYDPVTGRTFIGGLFRDANDIAGVEYWDGNLTSSDIYNADIRWELMQGGGQTFSVGAFFKYFQNPIEMVQFATQTGSFQPRNVGDGQVFGAELEFRQSLDFINEKLTNLMVTSNVTVTRSQIELSKTEYDSRVLNARTGQHIDRYRDMAGQAPYIINSGFMYNGSDNDSSFFNRFEAGVFYNVQGPTLQFVGIVDRPDIYTVPFHSINFNITKSFGKENRARVGLKVSNLLNDRKESVFRSVDATDQYFTRLSPGTTISLKLGYNIF